MYGNTMTLTAIPAVGVGLTFGWWVMTVVMAIFLVTALVQLTRRAPDERP